LKKPTKYDGYRELKAVTVHAVLNWGNYRYAYVRLTTDEVKPTEWREILLCEPECRMSNALNIIDLNRQLYMVLSGSMLRATTIGSPERLMRQARESGLVDHANAVPVLPEWLENQGKTFRYPVMLYPRIGEVPPVRVPLTPDSGNRAVPGLPEQLAGAVNAYRDFLAGYRALGIDLKTLERNDTTVLDRIDSVYDPAWQDYRRGKTFNVYEPRPAEASDTDALYSAVLEKYSAFAYAHAASQWDAIEIVASISGGADHFLYFYPIEGDERVAPLQILPMRKTAKGYELSIRAINSITGLVMGSKQVVSLMNDHFLGNKQLAVN
jgi:hypothetical protein